MVEKISSEKKFRLLLKHERVSLKKKDGGLIFTIPEKIYNAVIEKCDFSLEQLKVGGDLTLPDLANEINEHPSKEAYVAFLAETARYAMECAKSEAENWWEMKSFEVRCDLIKDLPKPPTEKQVSNFIHHEYKEEFLLYESKVKSLEYKYRLFNNVIRAAFVTKGTLLPTLRNIIQGSSGQGIGSIDIEKVQLENK